MYVTQNTMYGNGFLPLISIATHFKPGCKPSCIDNIITNSTDNIIKAGVIDTAATHHVPIFCMINFTHKIHEDEPIPPMYDYSESNMSKFERLFQAYITENNHFDSHEINEITFENFMNNTNKLVDDCFVMDTKLLHK